MTATRTEKPMDVSMDIDDVLTSRRMMQAVDVLGEYPDTLEASLELCYRVMRSIRTCIATAALDLMDVLPGESRVALEHCAGKGRLDWNPFVGFLLLVQPSNAPVRRKARICGNTGTRDEEDALAIAQTPRDLG
jgi:hypothetical protein